MESPKYTGKTVKIRKPVEIIRYNEKLVALMDELASYMMKKGEPFRSRAYKKADSRYEIVGSYRRGNKTSGGY